MVKVRRRQPRESRGAFPQRHQERWNVLGLLKFSLVEIISPAKRNDATLADESLEFKLLQRQRLDLVDELPFLVRGDDIRAILELFRQTRRACVEQIKLIGLGHVSLSGARRQNIVHVERSRGTSPSGKSR